MPAYIHGWQASSWLKYFVAFLVANDMFFLYPRRSLTTNFGDAGTHVGTDNTDYQVPLQAEKIDYRFSTLDQSKSVYDVFFENLRLHESMNIPRDALTVDLYGLKDDSPDTRYLLTRKCLDFAVIKAFGCCMRPHEANISEQIEGTDFFLYDLTMPMANSNHFDGVRKTQYNLRNISRTQYTNVLKIFINKTKKGIFRRVKR